MTLELLLLKHNTKGHDLKRSAGLEIRSETVYKPANDMVNVCPPTIAKSLFASSVYVCVCGGEYCRQPPTLASLRGNLISAFGLLLTP